MSNIEKWVEIGKKNPWIKEACDPPFDKHVFYECKTVDELVEKLKQGNWCLGQAFYYENICFINQVDGGDEWLVIRDDIPFESWGCRYVITKYGEQEFRETLDRMLKATPEQLRKLEY